MFHTFSPALLYAPKSEFARILTSLITSHSRKFRDWGHFWKFVPFPRTHPLKWNFASLPLSPSITTQKNVELFPLYRYRLLKRFQWGNMWKIWRNTWVRNKLGPRFAKLKKKNNNKKLFSPTILFFFPPIVRMRGLIFAAPCMWKIWRNMWKKCGNMLEIDCQVRKPRYSTFTACYTKYCCRECDWLCLTHALHYYTSEPNWEFCTLRRYIRTRFKTQ